MLPHDLRFPHSLPPYHALSRTLYPSYPSPRAHAASDAGTASLPKDQETLGVGGWSWGEKGLGGADAVEVERAGKIEFVGVIGSHREGGL
eukprot:9176193-Pyramimonas_sp.AAC.1